MYMPTEDVKEIWGEMTEAERDWYIRFVKAVDYGNMPILRELCEEAPSEKFEQLKAEIEYERNASKRAQYTIPKERKPRYSEWDYAWTQPSRVSMADAVQFDYFGVRETAEMYRPRKSK